MHWIPHWITLGICVLGFFLPSKPSRKAKAGAGAGAGTSNGKVDAGAASNGKLEERKKVK